MFVNKREKLLKAGWRHGILGVENPSDPGTEIYKDLQEQRNYTQDEKDNINRYRYRSKLQLV